MLELLILINMSRLKPLKLNTELTKIAEVRVNELCNGKFSHKGWNKPTNFSYRGENLYKGSEDIVSINKRFLDSTSHRNLMLSSKYQYIGIATGCDILVEEFGGISK
jgi:uncharacterized protein YkwD